ncbi:MAG: hypothetical protein FWE04_05545 [Oscillospiraceae bacterium]|nr:hypothetical protein [Oscillospiraceae bacterium]
MKKIITSILFVAGVFLLLLVLPNMINFIFMRNFSNFALRHTISIIPFVIILSLVILFTKLRKQSLKDTFYLRKPSRKNVGMAILLGALIGILQMSYTIAMFFSRDFIAIGFSNPMLGMILGNMLRISLIAAVPTIFVTVCREMILRGAIFSEIRKYMNAKWAIIALSLLSAVIFFAVIWSRFGLHLPFVTSALLILVNTLVLYILCYKSNSIWAPVAAGLTTSFFGVIHVMLEEMIMPLRVVEVIPTHMFNREFGDVDWGITVEQPSPWLTIIFTSVVLMLISLVLWRFWKGKKKAPLEKLAYHPAIEAAADYWCATVAEKASAEEGEMFREALLAGIAKVFDLPEGIIEIYSKVPNAAAYTAFEKPGKPSGVLRAALKKAKLKTSLLPQDITMTVSTSVVKVCGTSSGVIILWKAPIVTNNK